MSTAGAPKQAVQKVPLLLAMALVGWAGLQVATQLGLGDPSRLVALFIALFIALVLASRESTDG